jgi:hypothetical protein
VKYPECNDPEADRHDAIEKGLREPSVHNAPHITRGASGERSQRPTEPHAGYLHNRTVSLPLKLIENPPCPHVGASNVPNEPCGGGTWSLVGELPSATARLPRCCPCGRSGTECSRRTSRPAADAGRPAVVCDTRPFGLRPREGHAIVRSARASGLTMPASVGALIVSGSPSSIGGRGLCRPGSLSGNHGQSGLSVRCAPGTPPPRRTLPVHRAPCAAARDSPGRAASRIGVVPDTPEPLDSASRGVCRHHDHA